MAASPPDLPDLGLVASSADDATRAPPPGSELRHPSVAQRAHLPAPDPPRGPGDAAAGDARAHVWCAPHDRQVLGRRQISGVRVERRPLASLCVCVCVDASDDVTVRGRGCSLNTKL